MSAFANRYAQAFLDVVTSAKLDTAAIDAQLKDFLATWEGSSDLRGYFENPGVAAQQKVEFLDKLNAQLGLSKELRNLLAVMINNDRIAHVAEVAAAYRRLLQEQAGIRQAEIVTAREL
jgi:F-type H+-transporting ATPase subunit delta